MAPHLTDSGHPAIPAGVRHGASNSQGCVSQLLDLQPAPHGSRRLMSAPPVGRDAPNIGSENGSGDIAIKYKVEPLAKHSA